MPTSLAYLSSNKNVGELFAKIASAKVPPKFTHAFLGQTVGLKGTNDRSLIPLLRTLGYLDQSGTPTSKYAELKNPAIAKSSIGQAIRAAYAPLFAADENAHLLTGEKLKGLISQVAGTDEDMTARIASTFNALVKLADFSAPRLTATRRQKATTNKSRRTKDSSGRPSTERGCVPSFTTTFRSTFRPTARRTSISTSSTPSARYLNEYRRQCRSVRDARPDG
jgi:Family of unknown function (DUF5343)